MSTNKNKSSNRGQNQVPATPDPTSEYFKQDGVLRSQRVWDPQAKAYYNETFSTPEEQAIDKTATGFISKLVGQVPQTFDMSPETIARYREAYAAPQKAALNESYNQALGGANSAASATGMRNSLGFNRHLANNIERNRAQGLADIENNATMMEYQIPSMMLQPYGDAFNLVNAALSGEQARNMSSLEPAFQGSQQASNLAMQRYNADMNRWMLRNQNQNQNKGGFMNLLFGGF